MCVCCLYGGDRPPGGTGPDAQEMDTHKMLEKKPGGNGKESGPALSARQHCELIQNMIDISMSNLRGLRTQCAASNDLTQHEIRTLEVGEPKHCYDTSCHCHVPPPSPPHGAGPYYASLWGSVCVSYIFYVRGVGHRVTGSA